MLVISWIVYEVPLCKNCDVDPYATVTLPIDRAGMVERALLPTLNVLMVAALFVFATVTVLICTGFDA